ncbi:addiction module antidote protein [Methylomonas koyamae]|nr:addiction module antidote protein [Methylomonas koyamae]
MTKTIISRYDVAEHLRTTEEMAAYLDACIEEADGDAAFIAKALGDIARARGMSQIARDTGLSRESLYRSLDGEHIPSFDTILKVTKALGIHLHADPADLGIENPTARKLTLASNIIRLLAFLSLLTVNTRPDFGRSSDRQSGYWNVESNPGNCCSHTY